jgi:hypothetical protein
MTKLSDYDATMRQITRPCAVKSCPYAARHGDDRCGEHQVRQQQLPDADQAELKRLAERDRQRRAVAPRTGADPYRTERMVRSAMTTARKKDSR